jgi:hypothetical protein
MLAGCLTGAPQATPQRLSERMKPFQGASACDVVVMDVAFVEVPVGDHFVNQDLWTSADEQVIPAERRGSIEDNGLRIGLVGAVPPQGLLNLLMSPRSCPEPRRIQTHAGTETTVAIRPTLPHCGFRLFDESHPKGAAVVFEGADAGLIVTPTLLPNGHVSLQLLPEVEHGQTSLQPAPAADRSGWQLQQQRPSERYPYLGWEMTLAPGEYIVIGARYERPDTLGHRAFIRTEPAPVQKLLVIRAAPLKAEPMAGAITEDPSFQKAPPLACQAPFTGVRGASR